MRPSGRSPAAPEEASRPESPPPAPPSCVRYSGPSRRLRASSVISANALRTYRVGPAHFHSQPLDYHSELPGFLRKFSGVSVSTSAPIGSFHPPSRSPSLILLSELGSLRLTEALNRICSEALDSGITIIGIIRLSPDLRLRRCGAWMFGAGPGPEVRGLPGWPSLGFLGNLEAAAIVEV